MRGADRAASAWTSAVAAVGVLGVVLVGAAADHGAATASSTHAHTVPAPSVNPPAAGFPDAASTGVPAGTHLTPSGPIDVTTPGTTLDALDITDGVLIDAPNVTITRSSIHGSGNFGVYVRSGSLTITDSTITGFDNGITYDNWTARRVEITGQHDDGAKLGSNVTLADSWIHALATSPGSHSDGAQMQAGITNTTVTHNTIDPTSTTGTSANSALFLAPDLGPSTNGPLTITGNLLSGGNYTLFCVDGNNGQYYVSHITITDNTFTNTAQYGPARINVPVTFARNTYASTGAAITY